MKKIHRAMSHIPAWLPTVVTLVLILWLTLASRPLGDRELPLFPGADKLAHALMFGFLTAMALLDVQRHNHWHRLSEWFCLTVALSASALGVAIEFLQRAMNDGRSFEYADMGADALGAFFVALMWIWLQQRWILHNTDEK